MNKEEFKPGRLICYEGAQSKSVVIKDQNGHLITNTNGNLAIVDKIRQGDKFVLVEHSMYGLHKITTERNKAGYVFIAATTLSQYRLVC